MLLPRLALVSFGLEALGHGTVVGNGNQVTGIAHPIRVLFGFRTVMFIAMADTYSFVVAGDDITS